jgi:predicted nucleotidyltransferase
MGDKIIDKQDLLNKLSDFFRKRQNVVMAFLFGSIAKNRDSAKSDIDIALYLTEEGRSIERPIEIEIERLLKKEVDIVYLNRAPSIICWEAIREGIPIIIRDRLFFIDFMLEVSRDALDFVDFNLDAFRRKNEIRKIRSRTSSENS